MIAGEPSGDQLGQGLIRALRARVPDVQVSGVGGAAMGAENFVSLFPMDEISLMGVLPVLANLRNLLKRIDQTAKAVIAARPDALVLIDSPDFTHRVARKVRKVLPGLKIVNYVGPTVWAWRPGRAKRMRAYVDLILAIFPFEPEAHVRLGGPRCLYIGHPLIERQALLQGDDEAKTSGPVLVLPGSRSSVVLRMGGPFGDAIARLNQAHPGLDYILPTAPRVAGTVRDMIAGWPVKPIPAEGATDIYMWGDKSIEFHRCKVCGCATHWSAVDKTLDRMGVNARLMAPEVLAQARVRHLDGAVSWKYLDEA